MEREGVDYVVVESLGYRQTREYLVPAIHEYEDRFRMLWYDQDVPTCVMRLLPPSP